MAGSYSPLRHAARGVWGAYNPARTWFAVYSAYYDASGQELAGGFLSVAGLLATDRKWRRFESRWTEVLDKHEVGHLHMNEFIGCYGEFEGWRDNEYRQAAFLSELIQVIKQGMNKGFVYIIPSDSVGALANLFSGIGKDGAYAIAAESCSVSIERWLKQKHPGAPLMHFHEKGDKGQGLLHHSKRIQRPMAFPPKFDEETGRWIRQYEACDLVAWEFRRYLLDRALLRGPVRDAIFEIERQLPIQGYYFPFDELVQICVEMGLRPRHVPQGEP